ncbi:MAG: hypothetical protein ACD_87C00169G0002 [uncultured bacterium]|nr:MAG: hypothetical protein ACD_87C00169G0002 [uncultured bacterium]
MLDDHQRRLRNIDADFDDCRRYQYLHTLPDEFRHDPILLGPFHTSVNKPDLALRKDILPQMFRHAFGILEVKIFRLFNKRIHNKDLIALLHFPADNIVDPIPLGLEKHLRPDLLFARRQLIDNRDIEISVYRHC